MLEFYLLEAEICWSSTGDFLEIYARVPLELYKLEICRSYNAGDLLEFRWTFVGVPLEICSRYVGVMLDNVYQ